jgi:5'-nucleotidase
VYKKLLLVFISFFTIISLKTFALNIALTNDDGWDAKGIQSMKTALVNVGHHVVLVGPESDQSGSSAAIDLGFENLQITKEAVGEYSVKLIDGMGAEPATAGLVAVSIIQSNGDLVDLLISGINRGSNLGASVNSSGTVGAAIQGISYLSGNSIPSIAISTDEIYPPGSCDQLESICEAENNAHFDNVAYWMLEFIEQLVLKPGSLKKAEYLLPKGVMLNINYPPTKDIQGIALNRQGRLYSIDGETFNLPIGCYNDCENMAIGETSLGGILDVIAIPEAKDKKKSDTIAFNLGYISIVPMNTNLTAGKKIRNKFRKLIFNLNKDLSY